MRARNLKPGFFKNEILGGLDPLLRILFMGLPCMADREGRLEDRPQRIKIELLPYDEGIDCNEMLETLANGGFIIRYSVGGEKYIQVINFKRHNQPHIKEKPSTIPPPPQPLKGKPDADMAEAPDLHGASTVRTPDEHQKSTEQARLNPESLLLIHKAQSAAKTPGDKLPMPEQAPTLKKELFLKASELMRLNNGKQFDANQWVGKHLKQKSHPGAMLKALISLGDNWDGVKDPFAYAERIMKIENGNFHEQDAISENGKLDEGFQALGNILRSGGLEPRAGAP